MLIHNISRFIYSRLARNRVSRFLLSVHTMPQGSFTSKLLNRVVGVQDTLARLQLFYTNENPLAFNIARSYLESLQTLIGRRPTTLELAWAQKKDFAEASSLSVRANMLLSEAGQKVL